LFFSPFNSAMRNFLERLNPYDGTYLQGRIPSLDGLRCVAVFCVLLAHGWYSLKIPEVLKPYSHTYGVLGVTIFFVLSGFLIYNLTYKEICKNGKFNWKAFYLRRILRIFPCFYFYLFVVFILSLLGYYIVTWQILLSTATFTYNYQHLWYLTHPKPNDFHVVAQYWTLSLEEQFYLLWPLLVILIFRKNLQTALLVAIFAAPILRVSTYFFIPEWRGQLMMMAHTGFDSIAAGVLLGEWMVRARSKKILVAIAENPWSVWLSFLFLFLLSPSLKVAFQGSYNITIGATLDFIAIGILMIAVIRQKNSWTYRFLNWAPVMFIGTLSYSLYIWNPLFLYKNSTFPINIFPFNYIMVFFAAFFSYFLIEKPFLRLKEKILV